MKRPSSEGLYLYVRNSEQVWGPIIQAAGRATRVRWSLISSSLPQFNFSEHPARCFLGGPLAKIVFQTDSLPNIFPHLTNQPVRIGYNGGSGT